MRLVLCFLVILSLLFIGSNEVLAQVQIGAATDADIAASTEQDPVVSDKTGCIDLRASVASGATLSLKEFLFSRGGTLCPCTPAKTLWLERFVSCFAEKPGGLIYNSVGKIVTDSGYNTFYSSVVAVSVLLAVVLFGINLTLGAVQSIPKDSFVLVLKIAGVTLFFSQFMWVYSLATDAIQGLATLISTAAGNLGNMCDNTAAGGQAPSLWASWDCLFQKFTGLIGGNVGIGILLILTALFTSGGAGVAIGMGILYVILTLIFIAMRLVYTYLVAIIAVSFLFLLAPLFVPMILFGLTYKHFTTWLKMMIAYALQPMLLMLFMLLMLVALEFTIFVGPTSLMSIMANEEQTKANTFSEALSLVKTTNVNAGDFAGAVDAAAKAATGTVSDDWTKYIKRQNVLEFKRHVDAGVETLNQDAADALSPEDASLLSGLVTWIKGEQSTSTQQALEDSLNEGSHEGGLLLYSIDWDGFMEYLEKKNPPLESSITEDVWTQNVLLQLLALSILVFIFYNMAHAVPQITHDLVAQEFGLGFGSATKLRMLGESELRKGLEGVRETVRKGHETGDFGGAARQVVDDIIDGAAGTTGSRGGVS